MNNKISHSRRSVRVKAYNYSQPGAYFITVCAQGRRCLFGGIKNGQMRLNDIGRMADKWWRKIFDRYDNISIDEYIIMPNHIHGIINIVVGAIPCNRPINNVKNETDIDDVGENDKGENDRGENDKGENDRGENDRGENVVSPLRVPNTYNGLGQYIS